MSALPRGTCVDCGQEVAVRRNGDAREHRIYRPQLEQDTTTHLGRTRVCPGSGQPVVERPA